MKMFRFKILLHVGCLLLMVVLLMSTVGASTSFETSGSRDIDVTSFNITDDEVMASSSVNADKDAKDVSSIVASQDPDSGEMPLQVNVIDDPGFEEYVSGCPSAFTCQGSGVTNVDLSYTSETHSGFYAAEMKSKGNFSNVAQSIYQYPSLPVFLNESITLTFWFNIKENPALRYYGSSAPFYAYVFLVNTTSFTYYTIYYYLSYNVLYSDNSSTSAVYALNTTTFDSWTLFQRNVTQDFLATLGSPSSLGDVQISSVYLSIWSPSGSSGFVNVLVDDVSLVNGTNHEFLSNGDFEIGDGSGWMVPSSYSLGLLETSTIRAEGQQSLNLTAQTNTTRSYSYVGIQKYFSSQNSPYVIEHQSSRRQIIGFNWYYDDELINDSQYRAYFELGARNVSNTHYFRWYVGVGNDSFSFSNTSTTHMKFSSFGSRGSWHHEEIDLSWLGDQFSLGSFYLTTLRFQVEGRGIVGGKVSFLIDNVTLLMDPFGDADFESADLASPTNPLLSWAWIGSISNFNLTSSSHDGKHALNVTAEDNTQVRIYKSLLKPVSDELLSSKTYTDFWWKINTLSVGSTESSIYLRFWLEEDGSATKYLSYVLAATDSWLEFSAINSSDIVYYSVNHFNVTGGWYAFRRNIGRDVLNYFGDVNVTVSRLEAWVRAGSGALLSVLFDSFHLVHDTHAPTIHEVSFSSPQYFENATISINASDLLSEAIRVELTWTINPSSAQWMNREATRVGATQYSVVLPIYPFGTKINFHVIATDVAGNEAKDDNGGLNHSFTVTDEVSPDLVIIAPTNGSTLNGTVFLAIQASDDGSGIHSVSLLVDGALTYQVNDSSSFIYALNTTTLENGTHSFTFKAIDAAGNVKMVQHEYLIANPSVVTTPASNDNTSGTDSSDQQDFFQQLSQSFNNFMSKFGFFVGFVSVPVLWGFYKVLRWRFKRSSDVES